MKITIKYFGALEEVTQKAEETVELGNEVFDLAELKKRCLGKYHGMDQLSFQLAVNQSLQEEGSLKDGDEVAFLPPFAGG